MVCTSVLRLERHLNTLEVKDTLTSSDLLAAKCLLEYVQTFDVEFKEYHCAMIDLVKDHKHVIGEEQAVVDNHEHKFAEIIERMQGLWPEAKAAIFVVLSTGHSHQLRRSINNMEMNLRLVKGKVDPLTPGLSLDSYLLLQLAEQIGSIKLHLSDVHVCNP